MSRSLVLIIALVVLLAVPVFAQERGCCCDPVVRNGSIQTREDCDRQRFVFAGFPGFKTCSDHCNATLTEIVTGFCGDGLCQPNENSVSCAQDCARIEDGCGSPTFRPAPRNLIITPIEGKRAFYMTFQVPCPVDFITISRCEGLGCGNFSKVAEIPPGTSFTDESADLRFDTDYMYEVVAHYSQVGASEPVVAPASLGDIECLGRGQGSFCVSDATYVQYRDYLQRFGFAPYSAADFQAQFSRFVELAFGQRFNRAWSCRQNRLQGPEVSCDVGSFCVSDERGSRCARSEPCSDQSDPFGLFGSVASCEGVIPRYCFFDKSSTVVGQCYACSPKMSCYDYKSRDSCLRDNCGAGECEWRDTFGDLGFGVCVDRRRSNCLFCQEAGTQGLGNVNASSSVWDACREEKSLALSTISFPCFFDKELRISKGCDEVSCADYTEVQCASPVGGIRVLGDNNRATVSNDPCGIRVCEYNEVTGCVKKSDARSAFRDCKFGNRTCEADYFPPQTTLIPSGVAGRVDAVNIRIFDKLGKKESPIDASGRAGYITYLCVKNASSPCSDAGKFTIATNASQLLLKNKVLRDFKDGKLRILTQLAAGNNSVVYYSRDAANNLEVVKETVIFACEACQGPTLLNASVSAGRLLGNTFYTSATVPMFTFEFDEPSLVTFAEIRSEEGTIALSQLTQGMLSRHQFVASTGLFGNYTVHLNAKNAQNIFINATGLDYGLVVDPALAEVKILPRDGTIINKSVVDIELNFSRLVTLDNVSVVLESFSDPFVKRQIPSDVTALFRSEDNQSFEAAVNNLTGGGMHTIVVNALGFNALPVSAESRFFLATLKPQIRMANPTFGVTPYVTFDAVVETPLPSTCAYVFNTPTPPNPADFDFFRKFEGDQYVHTARGLQIGDQLQDEFLLHAYCRFPLFGLVNRTFRIVFDPEPPIILSAQAEPDVIAEQFFPDTELFVTTLKVQLDKAGFCKYSAVVPTFANMEGFFPGFDTTPKEVVLGDVNVTGRSAYTYFVACKGKNQLVSEPVQVRFSVDLSQPLRVKSTTPFGFGKKEFTIGVVGNKRVFCYFGETADAATRCMGACRSQYAQAQDFTVDSDGNYTYFVQCAHASGEKSDIVQVPVLVDSTPPEIEYVSDESALEDPQVSWSLKKLRVALKANDPESGVDYFLVSIRSLETRRFVVRDVVVNDTSGQPLYVETTENGTPLRLRDGERYEVEAVAVNRVGLRSEPQTSDGVLIDSSREPEPCQNAEKDGDETDVDCGGSCESCEENRLCARDSDCASNYCSGGKCLQASCTDGVMNGLESDVDCGGKLCSRCELDRGCIIDSDCGTGYCDPARKVCAIAPLCADKQLSEGETDIDCGGPCDRCGDGKTCQEHGDCVKGLSCHPEEKVCTTEPVSDDDADGVPDDVDKCLGSPLEESVDKEGCALSQKFSLGDRVDDKWRMDYFGCIDCPEAAADADGDGDGLTNRQEYDVGSNPKSWDTDFDGWSDGDEVEAGTSPTDPASHPPSTLKSLLWVLFILLVLGLVAFGGYLLTQMKGNEKPVRERREEKQWYVSEGRVAHKAKAFELSELRKFAQKEELPKEEWVSLERKIKKKALPRGKFEHEMEKLRRIAEVKEGGSPLERLRAHIASLSEKERDVLLKKIQRIKMGELSTEEFEAVLRKLKITAKYYAEHKEELEEELLRYAKRK